MGVAASAIASMAIGATLELWVHAVSGRREAWDSDIFWTTGLPIALGASLVVGAAAAGRAWLATALVVPAHVAVMMVRSGSGASLWPLTLALSAVLSAPFVAAAFVGSRLRHRLRR